MIHALPGMGADRRMFPKPWDSLPGFVAHDWPEYSGERTIAETAEKVAKQWLIGDGDMVVGTSLGGIVACEIARIRKLRALVLIGSAVDKDEVNPLLALLHPLAGIAPLEWLKFSAGKIPAELPRMFAGVDAEFMRSMCAAIFRWDGLGTTKVACHRVHGSRDRVIPPPPHVDFLLDGGHLISMTHAEECVKFVRRKAVT
jgi:pimeloyl-ACP methyl ester carboxylesterase